jgi:hypothetical protein
MSATLDSAKFSEYFHGDTGPKFFLLSRHTHGRGGYIQAHPRYMCLGSHTR